MLHWGLMRGKSWIVGAVVLGLLALLWPMAASAQSPDQTALELAQNINAYRQAQGLPSFSAQPALTGAAAEQAASMAAAVSITHTGLDGSTVYERAARAGYAGQVIEVIYAGPNGPSAVLEWWRNAELAASTLLNPSYQEMGIGAATGSDGWTYWAVVLGIPAAESSRGRSAETSATIPSTPLPSLTAVLPSLATPLPQPTNTPVPQPSPTPPALAALAASAPASPTPWPATFTPAPTRTPAPTATPPPAPTSPKGPVALAANVRGAAVRLADNVAAVRPTTAAPSAPSAAVQVPAEPTGRFDPVPLIVGLVALIGAAGLVYIGYQPSPTRRDPFRR